MNGDHCKPGMHFTSAELLHVSTDLTSAMQLSHREILGADLGAYEEEEKRNDCEKEEKGNRKKRKGVEKVHEKEQNNEQEIEKEKFNKYDGTRNRRRK
jgi:hypothetical protein